MTLWTVTLTTDVRPWRAGDDIHVEKGLAEMLVERKEAVNLRPFAGVEGYQTKVVEPSDPPAPIASEPKYQVKRGRPRKGV